MKNVFHVFSRMFTKFLGERPFKSTFSAHRADTFPAAVTPDLFRGRFTRNTQQAQFPLTEHVSLLPCAWRCLRYRLHSRNDTLPMSWSLAATMPLSAN